MDREDLADHFEWFADWCDGGTSPLYERLARGVADDPDLLDLAAEAPEGRSPSHLLFASVHYLLLSGRDTPLADYYPTVADDPLDPEGSDPFPAFREFCLSNADDIRKLSKRRRTQTNSVRRCAALFPAFEEVSRRASRGRTGRTRASRGNSREPLALVEIGPSAGLNLLWDRYEYDYGEAGRYGDPDSPVRIESSVREGRPPFPDELPPVASRVGVDLDPLDVTDDEDARWLRSLVWPEHDDRHRLLRAALDVARERPPDLREGDALEQLPEVVAEIPDDRPVCLFDTQVRYQLDEVDRERLDDLIAELGADRRLYVLSGDEASDEYEQAIDLTLTAAGDGRTERVAVYQQHGEWIAWDGR
ncbi:DUF2332 domain-containing protein [Halorussus salinisoli]|uniref:DUF2332 domain-containing protein n=1 Tax=Halorussus salinisoli TaxID=2558242 RepID=UPI0010C1C815|nr:DUF2332 domain-containing protein [Halorussus salinisoli]